MSQPTLFICLQCGSIGRDESGQKLPNPAASQLAEEVESLLENQPIRVELTRCLSLCTKPIAWGLRAQDKFNFTFAPATTAKDMAQLATQWLTTPQGQVRKKEMPESLRPTLASRLPPIPE